MKRMNFRKKLLQGLAVSGAQDTVRALNDGRVRKLVISSDLSPSPGWQCSNCLALYAGRHAKPGKCRHCGSAKFYVVDLIRAMISRALRHDCRLDVLNDCPELERVGGIVALLHGDKTPRAVTR